MPWFPISALNLPTNRLTCRLCQIAYICNPSKIQFPSCLSPPFSTYSFPYCQPLKNKFYSTCRCHPGSSLSSTLSDFQFICSMLCAPAVCLLHTPPAPPLITSAAGFLCLLSAFSKPQLLQGQPETFPSPQSPLQLHQPSALFL